MVEAVVRALREVCANPGRGSHRLALAASRVVFEAREALAILLGVPDSERLIFTLNATDGLNQVIHGTLTGPGEAVCSAYEHNAVMRPLRAWARRSGGRITVIPPAPDGPLDLGELRRALLRRPRLAVLTHASNVTGEVLPLAEAGELCRSAQVPLLVDAAQSAGHLPVRWGDLPVSAVAAAGHKGLLGPQGTGLLYLAPGFQPEPVRQGGTGGNSEEEAQPEWLPDRFESGTVNGPGIAGLGAAARWLAGRGIEAVWHHERALTGRLLAGLRGVPGVVVPGSPDPERRLGVTAFRVSGWDPVALGDQLDRRFEVLARSGLHCAPLAHRTLGAFPEGTVRFSVGWATTAAEVDAALEAVAWLAAREEAALCASS